MWIHLLIYVYLSLNVLAKWWVFTRACLICVFLIGPLDKLFGSQIILINPAAVAQASASTRLMKRSLFIEENQQPVVINSFIFLMSEDTEQKICHLYSTVLTFSYKSEKFLGCARYNCNQLQLLIIQLLAIFQAKA